MNSHSLAGSGLSGAEQPGWVERRTLAWLLFAQAVSILPLLLSLPKWIPGLWALALLWRIQVFRGAWPFPSAGSKLLLGIASIIALVFSFGGAWSVDPLVGFLVVSFVLKLIEARSRNDVLLIIYVGFIAVAAQFIFYQTFIIAVYACFSIIVLVCAWNSLYRTDTTPYWRQLRMSVVLIAQSLPLMLVLFIALPRLGSLWHVPIPKNTGVTGFSDSMSPGDLTSLSQSREVAFRVTFETGGGGAGAALPDREHWYWRGLVLDSFDGRRWRQANAGRTVPSERGAPSNWRLQMVQQSQQQRYSVLIEPHQQRWLFTLMAPVYANSSGLDTYFSSNYLLRTERPLSSRSHYNVVSITDYQAAPVSLSEAEYRANLALPAGKNPRAIALANSWRSQGLPARAMIKAAQQMYEASFVYTLKPPALGSNSVDDFLFNTQRGFCEHFSSSFVVLMRAAGIPARVVLGYQGGYLNPIENYIMVRQSDAHAWAEVWLAGEGWVRVDPTAAVSPLRVELGLEESLSEVDRELVGGLMDSPWLRQLQLRLDALSYSWHRWVLGYDSDRQSRFLSSLLGGSDAWRIGVFFIAFCGGFLILYFLWLTWVGRRRYAYPELEIYARLLRRLEKKGFTPFADETPIAFASRLAKAQPLWGSELLAIAKLYHLIAFEEQKSLLPKLKRAVAQAQLRHKS